MRHRRPTGLPIDGKEAYFAALLGFLTWHGIGPTFSVPTGARGSRLFGGITPASAPLRLPEPVNHTITQLTVTVRAALVTGGGSASS